MKKDVPSDWLAVLRQEFGKPYFADLESFVDAERSAHTVYPPEKDVLNAFHLTRFHKVKVVLLGQDPYPNEGQAHGLCFSVRPGVKPPPSLKNIFKELHHDLGCPQPESGSLEGWAKQGVLLLNAVLTVRARAANSHQGHGWEHFTDAAIQAINDHSKPVVFMLWGNYAQKKARWVNTVKHRVCASAHPSPLSARKFLGSKPFSAANRALEELGREPIDWCLTGAE